MTDTSAQTIDYSLVYCFWHVSADELIRITYLCHNCQRPFPSSVLRTYFHFTCPGMIVTRRSQYSLCPEIIPGFPNKFCPDIIPGLFMFMFDETLWSGRLQRWHGEWSRMDSSHIVFFYRRVYWNELVKGTFSIIAAEWYLIGHGGWNGSKSKPPSTITTSDFDMTWYDEEIGSKSLKVWHFTKVT